MTDDPKQKYLETLREAAQELERQLGVEAGIGAYEHWRYRYLKREDIVLNWLSVVEKERLPRA
jgi:hypothetical protein